MSFADSVTVKALQMAPTYMTFRSKHKFLQKSQQRDAKQLQEHQLRQLNKLLTHAHNNVSYYTKLSTGRELAPHDIWDLEDLEKLPFLTKEIVRY